MSIFGLYNLVTKIPFLFQQAASNDVQEPELVESNLGILDTPVQNLYGLIIGIDDYPSLPSLCGAVADANRMAEFLKVDLNVPDDRITVLRNEQATRSNIIQEFQKLWMNPSIQRNDPILVYYSGHGGLAKANNGWKERYGAKHIQVIFPFDYEQEVPGNDNSVKVNSIPDRTIAALLNKLATAKGDNITVIFDSCHSDSGTREVSVEFDQRGRKRDRRYRSSEVVLDIPHDIDDDLFALTGIDSSLQSKKQRDAQLLLHTDQTSHIHFAACGSHEKALEEDGQGIFTAELLKRIREARVENITYRNLMKFMNIADSQSPQCYGKNQDRILFDARISSRTTSFIPASFKEGTWTLGAGNASGVTQESIWELHETPTEVSKSIGRFKVTNLTISKATLEPLDPDIEPPMSDDDEGSRLYARCVRIGKGDQLVVKVWMSLDDQKVLFPSSPQHIGGSHESGLGYIMTSARDAADIVLEIQRSQPDLPTGATKPEVVFSWCDDVTKKYKATKLGHRIPASRDRVEAILFAAARWRWYLGHTNTSKQSVQGVTMNMLKVANRTGSRSTPLKKHENIAANWSGAVELVPDNMSLYGFKLKSKINSALYIRMFYFDTADFSIGDMFGHTTGSSKSASNIDANGELLIGDSVDGGSPVRFAMSLGNSVEVGYMKVYWSTEPLELDRIQQQSAFKPRPGDARGVFVDTSESDNEWGTVTLPMILRERK